MTTKMVVVVMTLCKRYEETTDHIISTCPILAKEQYI